MQVACGGAPYGESKLVFVANDWHASLLPVYLQASPPWHNIRSCMPTTDSLAMLFFWLMW